MTGANMKVLWIKILNPDNMQFFAGKYHTKEDEFGEYIEDEFGTQYSVSPEGIKDMEETYGWEIEVGYNESVR